MLEIKFKTDNAAFHDPYDGSEDDYFEAEEIARILKDVADRIRGGRRIGAIMDINGNKVGEFKLK